MQKMKESRYLKQSNRLVKSKCTKTDSFVFMWDMNSKEEGERRFEEDDHGGENGRRIYQIE